MSENKNKNLEVEKLIAWIPSSTIGATTSKTIELMQHTKLTARWSIEAIYPCYYCSYKCVNLYELMVNIEKIVDFFVHNILDVKNVLALLFTTVQSSGDFTGPIALKDLQTI